MQDVSRGTSQSNVVILSLSLNSSTRERTRRRKVRNGCPTGMFHVEHCHRTWMFIKSRQGCRRGKMRRRRQSALAASHGGVPCGTIARGTLGRNGLFPPCADQEKSSQGLWDCNRIPPVPP